MRVLVTARVLAGRLSRRGGSAARRGRIVVTVKGDFPEDEWARVVRAPFVAGLAISLADPGGPIEAFKETTDFEAADLEGALLDRAKARAMGVRARERVEKNFTWSAAADRVLALMG